MKSTVSRPRVETGTNRHRQPFRRLGVEQLEARWLPAASFLHNVVQPLDVNDDSQVTHMDVMVCVNELNGFGASGPKQFYMDVNADGQLSSMDLLLIINRLNRADPSPPQTPRAIDSSNNNLDHPDWGGPGTELLRITTPDYGDGLSQAAGASRASPRVISNRVAAQSEPRINDRALSDMVWQWGQFLDHDLDLTEAAEPPEPLPIQVPAGDPFFDPAGEGDRTIGFNRSQHSQSDSAPLPRPRQQINVITALIDGSNVYGSDPERAAALRTFSGGKLKTSDGNLLPFNVDGLDNGGGTGPNLFLAGDVRANEQVGLTAMHTLFVREHNRLAEEIAAEEPDLDDEQLYQRARALVIAHLQAITYNEFLPALLGAGALRPYRGHDDTINPGITNVFSTAAYRFGHSMLSPQLLRLEEDGTPIAGGHLKLRYAFFAPQEIVDHGIDSLLRGLIAQRAQEIDTQVVDEVRNFLFGPPGAGGFDLASLNIQRGRDHGLPRYNQVRADLGLAPVTGFADITSDTTLQQALSDAYDGDVNQIDVWVGGLAEDHLPGASVGELVSTVLVDQFQRLRDGDNYWYQRTFTGAELQRIEETRLSDVIRRNTDVVNIPDNVFFVV